MFLNFSQPPGRGLLNTVRAGFVVQDTSLRGWCLKNKVCWSRANIILLGGSNGKKAKKLREKIIAASNQQPPVE